MSFPEGKKDWFFILTFLVKLIEMISDTFFKVGDDGK